MTTPTLQPAARSLPAGAALVPTPTPTQDRARELIALGYRPVPMKADDPKQLAYRGDTRDWDYGPEHFKPGMGLQVRAGKQPDATYLTGFDLDSHGAGQNADRELDAFRAWCSPTLYAKLLRIPSNSGTGWWLVFRTYYGTHLHSGTLYADDRKIGDFICNGGTERIPDPLRAVEGNPRDLPILNQSEVERLSSFWQVRSATALGGATWTARAAEGKRLTAGYKRETVPTLRDFLRTHCGKVGFDLAGKLDTAERGERSDLLSSLAQCVMFNVHKLGSTGYSENCRRSKALIIQADAFGKALDKNYNPDKDIDALITKILHGDAKARYGDKPFVPPFWALAHPTGVNTTAAPSAERPAGNRATKRRELRLADIRRHLSAIEPINELGMRPFFIEGISDAPRRTTQADLRALRDAGEIATGQIDGNGMPYAILTDLFGGAKTCKKADKTASVIAETQGASEVVLLGAPMPKTDDESPQHNKEGRSPRFSAPTDNRAGRASGEPAPAGAQNLGVPPAEPAARPGAAVAPGGASYDPDFDTTIGGRRQPWVDPSVPRMRATSRDVPPPSPLRRRKPRQKGQASFLGRGDEVAARYKRKKRHGALPTPSTARECVRERSEPDHSAKGTAVADATAGATSPGATRTSRVPAQFWRLARQKIESA